MAAIPVSMAFFLLVPATGSEAGEPVFSGAVESRFDPGLQRAGFERGTAKVVSGTPPLPSRSLPRAVDARGQVHEPVIPADEVEEVSASEEGLPSPQSPRRVTELPPLSPVPAASPEPTA